MYFFVFINLIKIFNIVLEARLVDKSKLHEILEFPSALVWNETRHDKITISMEAFNNSKLPLLTLIALISSKRSVLATFFSSRLNRK